MVMKMGQNPLYLGIYVFIQLGFVKEREQTNDMEKGIEFKIPP